MAIRNLRHYALRVPDLGAGVQFYRDFGLEVEIRGNQAHCRSAGRDHDEVILFGGGPRALHHVRWGTDADGLGEISQKLALSGTVLLDAPPEWADDGIWFRDPDGDLLNLVVAEETEAPAEPPLANLPGHRDRHLERAAPLERREIKPLRLGHILLFARDLDKKMNFYTLVLGVAISDSLQRPGSPKPLAHWFYPTGGGEHHILAFGQSSAPGFHHAGFEVRNIDEIGQATATMSDKGYTLNWGIGRHGPGSNCFSYIRDPWNGMAEYFSDMDYIPAGSDWRAEVWTPGTPRGNWGPPQPADWGTNFEAIGRQGLGEANG